jgi:hypothetical protein
MQNELINHLTLKIMALGHSLRAARCLAGMILIQVVLLSTMLGYRVAEPAPLSWPADPLPRRDSGPAVVRICGIFPAVTGTTADTSRALLFTQ